MSDKKAKIPAAIDSKGSLVEVLNISKRVNKRINILQQVSLVINPGEFVVIIGQSGSGKTTLVDAIAGFRPATEGKVYVDGIDVYQNSESMRGKIGYVPQREIIHMELTVFQALDFSARLRMPKGTTKSERKERIEEVLAELDLENHKEMRISELSGGQQKRVSIGVELLTHPKLFFLDEPTSGMDPGSETTFMRLMRRLADQGRTVIMITHTTKNVMLADKALFMGCGGNMTWFGPPMEAVPYFSDFKDKEKGNEIPMDFDEIYAILDDPAFGNPKDWAERFQSSEAYKKYIEKPLRSRFQKEDVEKRKSRSRWKKSIKRHETETILQKKKEMISGWKQFQILSIRNLTILLRDRSSLILMLMIAPIVGSLDLILAILLGKDAFTFETGSIGEVSFIFFLWAIYALLVGGLSQMREFVKEASIYKKERLVNLKIIPYVASKIWVAVILSLYHALVFTLIRKVAFDIPGGFPVLSQIYITLLLATITGMMLGLLASAISNNQSATPLIFLLLTVPMFMFSGALAPIPDYLSIWATTRWSFQSMMGIVGVGSDIMQDSCWQLPEEIRNAMTLDDKDYFGCSCMGTTMFNKDSCNLPGMGTFYVQEIDQNSPNPPAVLPPIPIEPEIPDSPSAPSDMYNQIEVLKYLSELRDYQEEVEKIQDIYRDQLELYKAQTVIFQNDIEIYQEKLAKYTMARILAVSGAERTIEDVLERWEWTFVNKKDIAQYNSWLTKVWLAQVALIVIYLLIIMILIKQKDHQ